MGLISRVSSRTYRKYREEMFGAFRTAARNRFTQNFARRSHSNRAGPTNAPQMKWRTGVTNDPWMDKMQQVFAAIILSQIMYVWYHGHFAILNHGRGYVPAHTLTNEQLGLPNDPVEFQEMIDAFVAEENEKYGDKQVYKHRH